MASNNLKQMGMKKYGFFIGIGLLLGMASAQAQTIPQLAEQIVLDTEKLASLKSILQDMYKAYAIINAGYTDIKNISQGTFNLHKAFLDALMAVSPAVQNYGRVVDIINAEYSIVAEYKAAYSQFSANGHFTVQELDYMNTVYTNLFNKSLSCLNELTMVITANQLRMADAERLRAIDRVYADITGQLSFLRTFNNNTSIQAIQRAREANDIRTLKSIYGITP
jgi:hypothetical protein